MIAQLVRVACPTIFLDLLILSSSDLKAHSPTPYAYTIYEVISAESGGHEVTNALTGFRDSPLDLLYLGDEAVCKSSSGRNTKVAYLSEDIVQRLEALLVDGPMVHTYSTYIHSGTSFSIRTPPYTGIQDTFVCGRSMSE